MRYIQLISMYTFISFSSYIWKLKAEGINYKLTWKVIDRGIPYSPITNICNLCTKEKFYIITRPDLATINKRNVKF